MMCVSGGGGCLYIPSIELGRVGYWRAALLGRLVCIARLHETIGR